MAHLRRFLATAVLTGISLSSLGLPTAHAGAASVVPAIRPSVSANHVRVRAFPTRYRFRRSVDAAGSSRKVMIYHGGVVMTGPVNIYIIWYGNWSHKTKRRAIITDFVSGLAGRRFAINTTYPDRRGATVANSVTLAGQVYDKYSVGRTRISDDKIGVVVSNAIRSAKLPSDPHGIYLVITSNDVGKPGFLSKYCGWHTFKPVTSKTGTDSIKFAFIGDPTGPNIRACGPQRVSPNGDAGADAMVSVIAHEIDETVTDPELDAWYDSGGEENADRCAWTYGTTYTVGRARANVHVGSRDYLVQQNWLNTSKGGCVIEKPAG